LSPQTIFRILYKDHPEDNPYNSYAGEAIIPYYLFTEDTATAGYGSSLLSTIQSLVNSTIAPFNNAVQGIVSEVQYMLNHPFERRDRTNSIFSNFFIGLANAPLIGGLAHFSLGVLGIHVKDDRIYTTGFDMVTNLALLPNKILQPIIGELSKIAFLAKPITGMPVLKNLISGFKYIYNAPKNIIWNTRFTNWMENWAFKKYGGAGLKEFFEYVEREAVAEISTTSIKEIIKNTTGKIFYASENSLSNRWFASAWTYLRTNNIAGATTSLLKAFYLRPEMAGLKAIVGIQLTKMGITKSVREKIWEYLARLTARVQAKDTVTGNDETGALINSFLDDYNAITNLINNEIDKYRGYINEKTGLYKKKILDIVDTIPIINELI